MIETEKGGLHTQVGGPGFVTGAETNDPRHRVPGAELQKYHRSQLSNKATEIRALRNQARLQHGIINSLRRLSGIGNDEWNEIVRDAAVELNDGGDTPEVILQRMLDDFVEATRGVKS